MRNIVCLSKWEDPINILISDIRYWLSLTWLQPIIKKCIKHDFLLIVLSWYFIVHLVICLFWEEGEVRFTFI